MKIDEYFLRQASIFELRNIAREMGVVSPTIFRKEELIEKVLKIQNGQEKPQMPKSRQGRPPKSVFTKTPHATLPPTEKYVNYKDLVSQGETQKQYNFEPPKSFAEILSNNDFNYSLERKNDSNKDTQFGYFINVDNEFGFAFSFDTTGETSEEDKAVFVPQNVIKYCNLRQGDFIEYKTTNAQTSNEKFIYDVLSINGKTNFFEERNYFNKLQLNLNNNESFTLNNTITNKNESINIKQGSRNVFCVKNMNYAKSLINQWQSLKSKYHIVNLLLNLLPEDIASLQNEPNIENFFTSVGESNKQNIQITALAIERCKRLAELGEKVILIVSEAKCIIKHKNFSLDYSLEDIKYKSLDLCYQLLTLSRVLMSGSAISTLMFLKLDEEPTIFEKYIKEEFELLNCNFYNLEQV